jgi:membrane protease YdiL (CAAX protease family)
MVSKRPLPILETAGAGLILVLSLLINRYFTSVRQGTLLAFVGTILVPFLLGVSGYWLLRRRAPDVRLTRGGRRATGWAAGVLLGTLLLSLGAMVSDIPFDRPPVTWQLAQHLAVLLAVPVAEEIFFRGLVYRLTQEALGKVGGAVAVSLLFGFLHAWMPFGWVMVVMSLVLCWSVAATGTLWWAVILHLLWNGWAEAYHAPDATHRFIIVAVGATVALFMAWRGLATREPA